jgi:hypothetical protein
MAVRFLASHIKRGVWIVFKSRVLRTMYGSKEEVIEGWRK